jgi:hypothetical protein
MKQTLQTIERMLSHHTLHCGSVLRRLHERQEFEARHQQQAHRPATRIIPIWRLDRW